MSAYPPIHVPGRPGRQRAWSLRRLVLGLVLGTAACAGPAPSPSGSHSPATQTPTTPTSTDASEAGDIDGLVVLSGGTLSVGRLGGAFVTDAGPGGRIDAVSAANGRLIVQTAGPAIAVADIDRTASSAIAWRSVDAAIKGEGRGISAPALSPRGDKVVFLVIRTEDSFDVHTIDLGDRNAKITTFGRGANGPPVWIDESSLLLEVLPDPGGSRFLRMDLATGKVDPVAADGFGPAISGDGSLLAIASTNGSVVAVPAAGWLAGDPPDEGSLVDASGSVFDLAVDATGRRIAIAYADDGGNPTAIAVFVRDGDTWRRHPVEASVTPDDPTMLGWLN